MADNHSYSLLADAYDNANNKVTTILYIDADKEMSNVLKKVNEYQGMDFKMDLYGNKVRIIFSSSMENTISFLSFIKIL